MKQKQILYFLLLLACSNFCKSQDLIVTVTGDSLNCKITQVQKELIFFFYELDGEVIRSSISMNKVVDYHRDYYVMPGVLLRKEEQEKNIHRGKLRGGVYGGFSYMTGKIADNIDPLLQDHLKRLKKGFHVGGDFCVFLNKYTALGAKYSVFITQDEMNSVMFIDPASGNPFIGKVTEHLLIHYFAPNVFLRAGKETNKVFFIFDGSMGCLLYRNSGVLGVSNFTMAGFAFGVCVAPGLEFKVSRTFSINLNAGLTVGTLNRIKMDMGGQAMDTDNAKENVSRIDFSIGFHWCQ